MRYRCENCFDELEGDVRRVDIRFVWKLCFFDRGRTSNFWRVPSAVNDNVQPSDAQCRPSNSVWRVINVRVDAYSAKSDVWMWSARTGVRWQWNVSKPWHDVIPNGLP